MRVELLKSLRQRQVLSREGGRLEEWTELLYSGRVGSGRSFCFSVGTLCGILTCKPPPHATGRSSLTSAAETVAHTASPW